jgi:hypothetical protein
MVLLNEILWVTQTRQFLINEVPSPPFVVNDTNQLNFKNNLHHKNMQKAKRFLNFLLLTTFCPEKISKKQNKRVTATAVAGERCTATYKSGRLVFKVITGTSIATKQGVKQNYEITVSTVIEKPEDMNMECRVYHNGVDENMHLVIRPFEDDNTRFRLYNMNGTLLMEKKIENGELVIPVENVSPATWLVKVVNDSTEVRLFKIELN